MQHISQLARVTKGGAAINKEMSSVQDQMLCVKTAEREEPKCRLSAIALVVCALCLRN
jgi:hypothetical protein